MKLVRWPPSAVILENNSPVQAYKSPLSTGSRKNRAISPTSTAVPEETHPCRTASSARGTRATLWEQVLLPSQRHHPFPNLQGMSSYIFFSACALTNQCSKAKRVLKEQINTASVFHNDTFSPSMLLKHCCASRRRKLVGRAGENKKMHKLPFKTNISSYVWVFSFNLNSITVLQ